MIAALFELNLVGVPLAIVAAAPEATARFQENALSNGEYILNVFAILLKD